MVTRGHKGRTDANQTEAVKCLRQSGMSVQILSEIGQGCPDLLVGWRGVNLLIELKDGSQPPSKRELTGDERDWQAKWAGTVVTVSSPAAAVLAMIEYEGRNRR